MHEYNIRLHSNFGKMLCIEFDLMCCVTLLFNICIEKFHRIGLIYPFSVFY